MRIEDLELDLSTLPIERSYAADNPAVQLPTGWCEVFDAECRTVAVCPDAETAETVRQALTHYHRVAAPNPHQTSEP
jgi:hypothetical protein